jgi:hypothetical protein
MDPISLAVIAAAVLPRALPYLLKLGGAMGDSLAKEAGEKFGPEAWESAKSIWSRIGDTLLKKPAGKVAVDDVAKAPEDGDNVASLRKEIRKLLEEDPTLKEDLENVVKNRIKVDMALGEIVNEATVTGLDIEGEATNLHADVKIAADKVEKSKVTGVHIGKIG